LATTDPLLGPSPLDATHGVEHFECGISALNDFLSRQALIDQRAGKSRTYVATRGGHVVAYFSLAAASLAPEDASDRAAEGQGSQDTPAILLARFAVCAGEQRRGIGRGMLLEALARCAQAAEIVGARVVLVHAKDDGPRGEGPRAFYAKHDFEPSPANPLQLMILMKDVRRTFAIS
jgi:GNAT superfamily N-acetyltransferase